MHLPESHGRPPAHRGVSSGDSAVFAGCGMWRHRLEIGLLLAALLLAKPRRARAENAISYKYEDYREANGRVAVQAQYGLVEQDLGTDMHLKLLAVTDAIAGATPNGQPPTTLGGDVPLSKMHDRRKAWNADISRQFSRVNIDLGASNSRESDYVSDGWSLNMLTDFNQKNTILLLGVAHNDDKVKVFYQLPLEGKKTTDFVAGITQLLDPRTSVSVNAGYGSISGYLGDPYRVVLKTVEIIPGLFLPRTGGENRPRTKDQWTVSLLANRAYPDLNGALEAGYRLYRDTFGTTAHTVDLAWFHKISEHLTLRAGLRLYQQSAAEFYYISLDGTSIPLTVTPNPAGPFYSSDYRLSAFRSFDYSLKAIWKFNESWQVDATIDQYEMRGRDGITSPSAYPRASNTTFGIKFGW